jgi:RNA-directed DNA polymerase
MQSNLASRNLAAAFLCGAWSLDALLRRGAQAFGRSGRWLRPLVKRVLATFPEKPPGRAEDVLTTLIDADPGFSRAWERLKFAEEALGRFFWVPPLMAPAAGTPRTWSVTALPTRSSLADWLGLTVAQLDWFADVHGWEAIVPPGRLRHYTHLWLPKASGQWRLLEVPKPRLKSFQHRILHEILKRIPTHEAVHGYCPGRSIRTYTAPHCGQRIVLRFDLRHFFPSVRAARIHRVFYTAGYPFDVVRLLTGLCTSVVPEGVWETMPKSGKQPISWEERERHRVAHLPQGAPTSPALANLCAYRLDCRLHGLAQVLGARYTRYADDLAFSGGLELEQAARRFQVHVCRIALEEGFEIHTRKSRFMRQGVCQQLVGVVVNAHPNVRRETYDCLKATLHNCVRNGPDSQNRAGHVDFRAHLLGRVAHLAQINPARGQRLRSLFEQIRWLPEATNQ